MSVSKDTTEKVLNCFIPGCDSTSSDPSKILFRVPAWGLSSWTKIAKLTYTVKTTDRLYCCVDHFDIPDDFKNWYYSRYVGTRLHVKIGVIPHKHLDGKSENHPLLESSERKEIFKRLLNNNETIETPIVVSTRNKKTTRKSESTSCDSVSVLNSLRNNEVPSDTCPCFVQLLPYNSPNEGNQKCGKAEPIAERKKKKVHWFEKTVNYVPIEKKRPNILRHPTKNSKPETSNDKQKNAPTPTKLLLKTTPNHIPQINSKRHFNLDDKKEETPKKNEVKVKGHRVYRIEKSFFVDDAGKSNLRLKDLSTMIGQPVPISKPKNVEAKSMVVRSTTLKGTETERASSISEPLKKKKFITVKKSQASAVLKEPQPRNEVAETPTKLVDLEKPKEVSSEDVVEIKKEPVDAESEQVKVDCPPGQDDEDTLSASETLNREDVRSMLNSVDDADNYVDVPEFVQIDKFTIQDLQDLRAKGVVIPPDILQALPPVENALLQKTHVDATPKNPSSSETPVEKPKAGNVVKARPKPRITLSIKPARALMKSAAASGKRSRKRKVKIAPVDSPVVSPKIAYVESLVYVPTSPKKKESKKALLGAYKNDCVLYTNYDEDGFYINDHDYLPTPYKRNRILTKEKGEIAYNCWICGSKHRTGDHVSHMSAHRTECGICETDFGTCYMLNMHMKSHASECRQCKALVAHPRLDEHDKTCQKINSSTKSNDEEQKKFPHIPALTSPCKKTPVKRKSTSPCKKSSSSAAKKMTPDKTSSCGMKIGETASPRELLKRKKNSEVGREKGEEKMTLRSTPRKTEI